MQDGLGEGGDSFKARSPNDDCDDEQGDAVGHPDEELD